MRIMIQWKKLRRKEMEERKKKKKIGYVWFAFQEKGGGVRDGVLSLGRWRKG